MAHKSESAITEEDGITGLEWRVASETKNIQEVIVTRDFDAEMAAFSDKYSEYKNQTDKLRSRWPNPYPDEYYKLEEETFKAIPQLNKYQKREIEPRYHSEYIREFYKHGDSIVSMWKDLEILENDPSTVTAETCVKLVSKAWGSIEGHDISYSDYPAENKEYVCILNEVFQPTLVTISRSCQNLSEEQRTAIADELKDFVIESQDYNTWYFDRIQAVSEAIVNIIGVDGLSDVQDIISNLEAGRNDRNENDSQFYIEELRSDVNRLEKLEKNRDAVIEQEYWGDVKQYEQEVARLKESINESPFYWDVFNLDEDQSLTDEDRASLRRAIDHQRSEDHVDTSYLEWDESDHFHLHMNLVRHISSQGWTEEEKPQVAEFLCKFMEEQSAGSLHAYVEAFQKLGLESSVQPLLQNLKNESVLARRMSAETLFRLELGKVGVTEEGVEYLGKLYDLGKYNDPDFFVRRLNSSGLIAVLGQKGSIEGVFPLDLYAETSTVEAEVRQLMSQELFLPKADETPEQRKQREEYLGLFLKNYESIFNDGFFEGTNVKLNSLDLHEQGWFLLNYLKLSNQEDTHELERLESFVRQYGEYGLKSFLALEYGGSGKEILDFAASSELTTEEKSTIFKNFYSIANEATNWRGVFSQAEAGTGYEFAAQVHEAFIRKNAEFFRAAQLIARGEGGEVTMAELQKNMNTITFALRALKGTYGERSKLKLALKPQTQDEHDKDGNLIEAASTSYILEDTKAGARIVLSIRPQPTVRQGEVSGGEARINFSVTNMKTKEVARIGFDLSDYGDFIGQEGKVPVVSLDLGVGKPDREAGIWPSQRVGRVLELVEGSEGGHNELSFKPEVAQHFPEVAKRFKAYIESRFVVKS